MTSLKKTLPILGLLLTLPACATAPLQPVQGQVLEEGTNKPIAGAIVVGLWYGTSAPGFFVDSRTVCYHVETAATDEAGRFTFPPTEKEYKYRDGHHYTSTIAYKPGYHYAPVQHKGTDILQPLVGAREEKLRKTAGAAVTCGSAGESKKNLLPLYKKLYAEAVPLVVTKEDKYILSNLLFKIEALELPYEEANKRHIDRHNAIHKE